MPAIGLGALKAAPDEQVLYETEKEKTLLVPRDDFWPMVAEQCAEQGVGVSMFLGMSRPIDVASIGGIFQFDYCIFDADSVT